MEETRVELIITVFLADLKGWAIGGSWQGGQLSLLVLTGLMGR